MKTLRGFLNKYYELQDDITLVYRPSAKSWWNNRCQYLDDRYIPNTPYNHRSILRNEVVVEFDNEDKKKNETFINAVRKSLHKDGISYHLWFSGGKSYHLHFLINTKTASNIKLLKTVILRYYSEGLPELPDMRMADNNHLIRAEYGLHENKGTYKKLVFKSRNYLKINELPQAVWSEYVKKMTTVVKRRTTIDMKDVLNSKELALVLSSTDFRNKIGDGRERLLWMLIHLLKSKHTKESLNRYLWEWYKYSGGYKLSLEDIKSKVNYHWNRNYNITIDSISDLLKELGVEVK